MPEPEIEQTLRDLPRIGKLVKHRSYRQVWRFECTGRPYYLKFYPRNGVRNWLRRSFRGSPALREFHRLKWLQEAGVPAPRAVAALMGFILNGRKGDAVILEGIEPSIPLDKHLNQLEQTGQEVGNRLALARRLSSLLEKLGRAGLGHSDLHLGNILLKGDELYLLDGYAVHKGGLHMDDILLLALSAQPYATRTDIVRIWKKLGSGAPLPPSNRLGPAVWRGLLNRAFNKDRYFGHLKLEEWSGHFFRHAKFPHRWSAVSRLDITEKDWLDAWPILLKQLESDQFEILKRTRSGDVLAGEIILGGRPIPVIIKRPRRKHWYRYLNEIGRGTRARRAWKRAWQLIVRNIPTAWPLLLMEKRSFGYATDAMVIFERVSGDTLASPRLRDHGQEAYHRLLRRAGRLLRKLEQSGLYLYDAKAANWMVREDERLGLLPILIDVDSVRRLNQGGGLPRLLRSLYENSRLQFNTADALVLAQGYAPFASRLRLQRLADSEAKPVPQAPLFDPSREARG